LVPVIGFMLTGFVYGIHLCSSFNGVLKCNYKEIKVGHNL